MRSSPSGAGAAGKRKRGRKEEENRKRQKRKMKAELRNLLSVTRGAGAFRREIRSYFEQTGEFLIKLSFTAELNRDSYAQN